MPLSKIQVEILQLLAGHRDPESYVAGSTPLNRDTARFSADIDVFHDREQRVAAAAEADAALLLTRGFDLRWLRREPAIYTVLASHAGEATRLDWAVDSDFRFFPTVPDEMFGYRLHPVDLATSKAMAAAGRREPRDIMDLLTIHDRILPIGAVMWAAVGKSLGFTPEGLIQEIRRLAQYSEPDFRRIASAAPVDGGAILTRFRGLLEEAEKFVGQMPTELAGLIFLWRGQAVQPDAARLEQYEVHRGERRGHWPSSPAIETAMLPHPALPGPQDGI